MSYSDQHGLLPLIGTWSRYGPGSNGGAALSMSSNWTAQLAVYIPMSFPMAVPVKKLWWINGSNITSNSDVGIYDSAGNKIVSTGAIAGGTASQLTSNDVGDLTLPPGEYYFAGWRATTDRFGLAGGIVHVTMLQAMGVRYEGSLASGLPSTATFATPASSVFFPILGVDTVGIT